MIPRVVLALRAGHENAIKRHDLARLLDVPDREMRKMIEQARQEGWQILNKGDGAGYYLATSLEELERHYRVERSRAIKTLYNLKPIRAVLKANGRKV